MAEIEKTYTLSSFAEEFGLEEAVQFAMEAFGMSEADARFEILVGLGTIEGDVKDG